MKALKDKYDIYAKLFGIFLLKVSFYLNSKFYI